jgi:hypothetical protein
VLLLRGASYRLKGKGKEVLLGDEGMDRTFKTAPKTATSEAPHPELPLEDRGAAPPEPTLASHFLE